jgi:hypothetical protein
MDVLVRLATEAPDLSGLPGSLAGIVMACLERDPRKRPSSAAVLANMAPFISPEPDGRDAGSASLPGVALGMLAEYRRDPGPAADARAETGEDATFGSQPALGAPGGPLGAADRSLARRGALPRRVASLRARSRHGHPREASAGSVNKPAKPRWRRALLIFASAVAAAAVLMTSGAVIGASIVGSRPLPLPPPPPQSQQPAAALSELPPGRPGIIMNQTSGDSRTVFVVIGRGWAPGSAVTVALAGVRASPEHPVADSAGTFNYAINQNHEFFRGGLPPRIYHVLVTAPGGASSMASFTVDRG